MEYNILTLFPEMITSSCNFSIIKRAKETNKISINTINPRDFSKNKHKKVDDTIFGGGCGMLLCVEPFVEAYNSIKKKENNITIILSPQGKVYNQQIAYNLSKLSQINILCGHYEGFDERILKLTNAKEISIGDYILTGGEIGALIIIDSVSRLIRGVLNKEDSYINDSFNENLLDYPQYTKPREYKDLKVPQVLLNGNHKEIEYYRRFMKIKNTKEKRPDIFEKFIKGNLTPLDVEILNKLNNS